MAQISGEPLLAVLRAPEFWRCYVYDYDAVAVDAEGERLAGQIGDTVVLDLPAHQTWRLRLEMSVDLGMYDLYLATTDPRRRDQKYELGDWYRCAGTRGACGGRRWRPWCGGCARTRPRSSSRRSWPCCCSPGSSATAPARPTCSPPGAASSPASSRGLGLFTSAEAERMAERILITAPEDDYAWRRCPERGWVFGGADPAYSFRNHEHDFPFAEFAEFRGLLGLADLG